MVQNIQKITALPFTKLRLVSRRKYPRAVRNHARNWIHESVFESAKLKVLRLFPFESCCTRFRENGGMDTVTRQIKWELNYPPRTFPIHPKGAWPINRPSKVVSSQSVTVRQIFPGENFYVRRPSTRRGKCRKGARRGIRQTRRGDRESKNNNPTEGARHACHTDLGNAAIFTKPPRACKHSWATEADSWGPTCWVKKMKKQKKGETFLFFFLLRKLRVKEGRNGKRDARADKRQRPFFSSLLDRPFKAKAFSVGPTASRQKTNALPCRPVGRLEVPIYLWTRGACVEPDFHRVETETWKGRNRNGSRRNNTHIDHEVVVVQQCTHKLCIGVHLHRS